MLPRIELLSFIVFLSLSSLQNYPCLAFLAPRPQFKSLLPLKISRCAKTSPSCRTAVASSSSDAAKKILLRGGRFVDSLIGKLGYPAKKTGRPSKEGSRIEFAGTVTEIGIVSEISAELRVPGVTLTIDCLAISDDAYEGCSVTVNGVALLVTKCERNLLRVRDLPHLILSFSFFGCFLIMF
jgi:hypothetical protein